MNSRRVQAFLKLQALRAIGGSKEYGLIPRAASPVLSINGRSNRIEEHSGQSID